MKRKTSCRKHSYAVSLIPRRLGFHFSDGLVLPGPYNPLTDHFRRQTQRRNVVSAGPHSVVALLGPNLDKVTKEPQSCEQEPASIARALQRQFGRPAGVVPATCVRGRAKTQGSASPLAVPSLR